MPVISGGAITREMTVLFFSLSCSPSRCPLFSSFSSSHFPCAVPLHAPLSCWAVNITKMALARHVHTHAYTYETVNILARLGKCICAISFDKSTVKQTEGMCNSIKPTLEVIHPSWEQTILHDFACACVCACECV